MSTVPDSLQPNKGVVVVAPDTELLKAGLVVWLALAAACIILVLGGAVEEPLGVALSGAAFAAFAGVAGASLRSGACSLELGPQGFVYTSLFRRRRYAWREVAGFRVVSDEEGADVVGFDLATRPLHRRLARIFIGVDQTLPPSGVAPVELAAAMNSWLRVYGAQRCTKNSASPTAVPSTTA